MDAMQTRVCLVYGELCTITMACPMHLSSLATLTEPLNQLSDFPSIYIFIFIYSFIDCIHLFTFFCSFVYHFIVLKFSIVA